MRSSAVLTVAGVMTPSSGYVREDTSFKDVVRILADSHHEALPVVDADLRVVGVVSAADLLARYGTGWREHFSAKRHATRAADLMAAPAITVDPQTPIPDAARLAAHAHVHLLPVVDHAGVLLGVVTRADLAKVFLRPDGDIRDDVEEQIAVRRHAAEPGAVRAAVDDGVVVLTGRVATVADARRLAEAAQRIVGVVDVMNLLDTDPEAEADTPADTGGDGDGGEAAAPHEASPGRTCVQ